MNENPGETPNPLNPTQAAGTYPNPAAPSASSVAPNPAVPAKPATPNSVAKDTNSAAPQVVSNVMVESLDPSGRPMEKVPDAIPEPPEKKKTGLIVSIIVAAVILLGGIIAAVVVALNIGNGEDAVATAIAKLMNGDAPSNVAIDGTIDFLPNDADLPIKRIGIALDSSLIVGSNINNSSAILNVTTSDDKDYALEFDEVYAADGNLYLKVDGATAALEDSGLLDLFMPVETTKDDSTSPLQDIPNTELSQDNSSTKLPDADGEEPSINADSIMNIVELVDGTWIRISTEELGALTSNGRLAESKISCITDLVNDINTNSNSAIELYNKYPFYSSNSKNLTVASKGNPIYQLLIDSDNFANFVNSISNVKLTNDLYSCMGWEGNVSISKDDAANMVASLPEMYVEVDANHDFTRFYSQTETEQGAEILVDLSFAYPANVNVPEPIEYTDYSDLIQTIMTSVFNLQNEDDGTDAIVVDE